MTWMRATAEAVVRIQLLLLAPLTVVLVGFAAKRGGGWLVLLAPAALLLVGHARALSRTHIRSWGAALGNLGLLVALTAIVLLVVAPVLGFYRTVTVLTGSMRPTFYPGDMIVVSPEPMARLRVGDVITFRIPIDGKPVETHRVVSITHAGNQPIVQTKGDANNTIDPWHAELHGDTVWRYTHRIPGAGYPLLALRSRWAHWATVLLPFVLALWGLAKLWSPSRRLPTNNVSLNV
jgi:signal peptidase